ncbi:hypothetical protein GGR42_003146 [Saonia flava]|uniref:Uncharacterized protein n=1 Tax=Saonia flava TaxID=523696 RepID=A0A846R3V8_9FLAO|nr:DUF6747 family protein [Saonia flava]NJB72655.1 hypothetical protein [Saonia flava]
MKKLLLIRELYIEAFKNFGNIIIRNSFKIYSWMCIALIFVVLYAFIFRISTGFIFD